MAVTLTRECQTHLVPQAKCVAWVWSAGQIQQLLCISTYPSWTAPPAAPVPATGGSMQHVALPAAGAELRRMQHLLRIHAACSVWVPQAALVPDCLEQASCAACIQESQGGYHMCCMSWALHTAPVRINSDPGAALGVK